MLASDDTKTIINVHNIMNENEIYLFATDINCCLLHVQLTDAWYLLTLSSFTIHFVESIARRRLSQDDIIPCPMFLSQGLLGSLRIYISLKYDGLSMHVLIRHAVYSNLSE